MILEMRKIREHLGKREQGRKINSIMASPSLTSPWLWPKIALEREYVPGGAKLVSGR